jgi:hypothetical protein
MATKNASPQKGNGDGESIDEKRARFEQFSFRVPTDSEGEPIGFANVANHSYGDSEAGEHCYSVEIANGEAIGCSCPHRTHRSPSGGCKHMRAVENRDAVIVAASEAGQ